MDVMLALLITQFFSLFAVIAVLLMKITRITEENEDLKNRIKNYEFYISISGRDRD